MAASQIEIVSDSTKESEPVVADPAQNSTNTVTVDNIFTASEHGDLEKLRKFVEQDGASLSSPDNFGDYALHWAALNNHTETVQYIIEHGGDVNAVNNDNQTALHYAAVGGWISVADVLLQNGAQIEAANVNGGRAVHFAAEFGQISFLKHIVVKYNADFDVPDKFKCRPLHWAATNNHPEIAQYIIEHGGDVNAVNKFQQTTLHIVASRGSIYVADMLLQNGALVEAVDAEGNKAVHIAAQEGHTSFFKHIVAKYNANFDVANNEGMKPLHRAVANNHHEIAQYIVEHGGDVNAVSDCQQTALHLAAMGGSISVADLLLHNGAHVEAVDWNGQRAVHLAAGNGQTSFLNHIVDKHNADFDVPDNDGRSPLHWAAGSGQVDTITWLMSKNASRKRQDVLGYTPLHTAAFYGHIDAFMVLMDAATEQEIMMKDNEGNTAIQLSPILASKALYEECKNSSNCHFGDIPEGTNRPMIIAMQGDAYTGKTLLAFDLALRIKCPIISLDNFLDATEPTDKRDTLISNTFNIITEVVKTQLILGFSVIVDSPLSRLSHLQKLAHLAYEKSTKLLIIECKPKNEYAYQLRFEEEGSLVYANSWYKPTTAWPLPKVPRDYTDDDIPYGVSKLVVDTHDHHLPCQLLRAMFDVASCGYGHKTKYHEAWEFIHTDKKEQFTCPCHYCKSNNSNKDVNLHKFTFHDASNMDALCGVCDIPVHDFHYTCMDCPLVLHQSCAELARGKKKHFVPESFPVFLPSEPHFRYTFPIEHPCAECSSKDGKGFSCKCKDCLFESHMKSRLVPTIVRHKVHDDFLTFWFNFYAGDSVISSYTCLACKKTGHCAMYILDGNITYHPQCVLLPPSVHHSHGGYTHDLEMIISRVEKEEDYMCDCCSIKMDPSAWYYYCIECNIQLHLECAFLDFDTGRPITEARS